MNALARAVLWWLFGCGLVLVAGEAEFARRQVVAAPVCIGSVILLRGSSCDAGQRNARPPAMVLKWTGSRSRRGSG